MVSKRKINRSYYREKDRGDALRRRQLCRPGLEHVENKQVGFETIKYVGKFGGGELKGVYFVVTNATACAYAAISLLLLSANRGPKKRVAMMIVIFDLMIIALLFSSLGAVLAVGLKGNSHVQWHEVCSVFGKFCNQGATAIDHSGVASLVFLVLVLIAILKLHKKR
ncbi:CASP-like protein 1E1 [Sesamum alatum]|uniref:CASP-like protein n=1 Tax=Sesamum alatum TaxID=300844 RepID=A0AAE1YPU5_9LAMI|nr:CASP-like protein 1E1 [Sesamum alatum]